MTEEMPCRKRRLSSFQIIILGFAGVILLGALLLMLPLSTTAGCVTPFHEALFTTTTVWCGRVGKAGHQKLDKTFALPNLHKQSPHLYSILIRRKCPLSALKISGCIINYHRNKELPLCRKRSFVESAAFRLFKLSY